MEKKHSNSTDARPSCFFLRRATRAAALPFARRGSSGQVTANGASRVTITITPRNIVRDRSLRTCKTGANDEHALRGIEVRHFAQIISTIAGSV